MWFASDGGTAVTGVAPDRQRQDVRSSVGEGVRRRTAKTLRPTHMRPPMAVPASVDNKEPLWPDLRNMDWAEAPCHNNGLERLVSEAHL